MYSPLTAGILLVGIFFLGYATIKMSFEYLETARDYKAALVAFEKLKNREKNIEDKVHALQTERGIEDEIRNTFGFVKEGEDVVIIVEPPLLVDIKKKEEQTSGRAGRIFDSILSVFR